MSEKTVTTWKCSRCGRTVHIDHAGVLASAYDAQPLSWQRIVVTSPPKASTSGEQATQWDLCNVCKAELARFFAGAELIPPQGITFGWLIEDASRVLDPEVEPVDALTTALSMRQRDVFATALRANGPLEQVIASGGGLFGDWLADGKIPDIAPTRLATLSTEAWRAWWLARQPVPDNPFGLTADTAQTVAAEILAQAHEAGA